MRCIIALSILSIGNGCAYKAVYTPEERQCLQRCDEIDLNFQELTKDGKCFCKKPILKNPESL